MGFLYLRPRFYFGRGVPHERWMGLELNPIISGSGGGLYTGVRGELPGFDVRLGARYRFAWTRSFLAPLDGYDHLQVRDRSGPNANYVSLEAQVSYAIPIENMAVVGEVTASYVLPLQGGFFLYEDTLRLIVAAPGFVWGLSCFYRFRFGDDDAFSVEPGFELVHMPARGASVLLRVGAHAAVRMFPDLEARLTVLPGIIGPDRLGAGGGHSFLLGLRYRWATDTPRFGGES